MSNWAKIAIGVGVIVLCAAVTVATAGTGTALACLAAGALEGAITGAASGAVIGAATGAVSHRISTGSWEGAGQAAIDGAADGFMTGAISGAVTGALTSPYCFVAGTLVQTENGEKPIEEIDVGDYVWAWDEKTGEVALRPVLETYINETDELIHVFVNGEEIISTPGHPFYSPVKGWTDAVHLRAGDILVLVNGEYVVVEKVQHELLEVPINVYNFNVEGFHTYFVSSLGVLVHNTCSTQRGLARQKAAKMTNTEKITINGRNRIPDYLNKERGVMGEAKSVRYLTKSPQLEDMFSYAHQEGYKMFLKVERWTKISGPLQELINNYNVVVNVF